jgi:N-acyl amino acid synthase of PEP-CTERM/exosortase system
MENTTTPEASFDKHFNILYADTAPLVEKALRLRYDVYCREFQYEREEDCPGGIERDEYDAEAVHLLVVHRASDVPAGCVRMITARPKEPTFLLPMERHCGHTLKETDRHPGRLPRERIAEISRLAVHTSFRRRAGEKDSETGALKREAFTDEEQRTFPLISLALFAGATALLALTERQHMLVMMEPRLARLLRSLGFPFVQIGERTEYHGIRAAYYVNVDECLDSWGETMQRMYRSVYASLRSKGPTGADSLGA